MQLISLHRFYAPKNVFCYKGLLLANRGSGNVIILVLSDGQRHIITETYIKALQTESTFKAYPLYMQGKKVIIERSWLVNSLTT